MLKQIGFLLATVLVAFAVGSLAVVAGISLMPSAAVEAARPPVSPEDTCMCGQDSVVTGQWPYGNGWCLTQRYYPNSSPHYRMSDEPCY
jgi:hypothetical protein